MLQLKKKQLRLHERTATSIKRNEVSALKIKTLACKENLTRALRTSCVTCKQSQQASIIREIAFFRVTEKTNIGQSAKGDLPEIF